MENFENRNENENDDYERLCIKAAQLLEEYEQLILDRDDALRVLEQTESENPELSVYRNKVDISKGRKSSLNDLASRLTRDDNSNNKMIVANLNERLALELDLITDINEEMREIIKSGEDS